MREATRKMIEALHYTLLHRRLFYGVGQKSRLSLDEAAIKIGIIKKKTLDDYFIQLKMAYLTGMDLRNYSTIDMG